MEILGGFLLGLANGPTCLTYCLPFLVPYFLVEGKNVRENYAKLSTFLVGRFLGYIVFAIMVGVASKIIKLDASFKEMLFGSVYILFAIMMVIYSFIDFKPLACGVRVSRNFIKVHFANIPNIIPLIFGLLTGINLCPPFLIAITEALQKGSVLYSIIFFIAFFFGTLIYFLPIPFIGLLRKIENVKFIGKIVAIIMAGYYLCLGIITIIGGLGL